MIGYQKEPLNKKGGTRWAHWKKFLLRDERDERALVATTNYNCDYRGGGLRPGLGSSPYKDVSGAEVATTLEQDVLSVYPFTTDYGTQTFMLVGKDGHLYLLDNKTGTVSPKVPVGEYPTYCSLRTEKLEEYHLLLGSKGGYVMRNGVDFQFAAYSSSGDLVGCCVAGKRFFFAENDKKIKYTAPYQPLQWEGESSEGGELYMPLGGGKLVGIASHGNDVYLCGQRAVYRVQVKAQATDFIVEKLAYGGGEICPRSAVSTGSSVLFMATDGLYCAQGGRVEKDDAFSLPYPKAGTPCRLGKCEDLTLFEYSTADGESVRFAVYADGKDAFRVQLVGKLGGNEYYFSKGKMQKYTRGAQGASALSSTYFETAKTDFGRKGRKTLKRIRLYGKGTISLRVYGDNYGHSYTVETYRGIGETLLFDFGETFLFRFTLSQGSELRGVSVEYACLEG